MRPHARIMSLMLMHALLFVSCAVSKHTITGHEFRKEYSAEFKRLSTRLPSNMVKARLSVYRSYLILACPVNLTVNVYDKNRGKCILACSLSQDGKRNIARCCNIDTETGVIDFWGIPDSTHLSVQVDSLLSFGFTAVSVECSTDGRVGNTIITDTKYGRLSVNNTTMFWEDTSGMPRIQLKDSSGIPLSSIRNYPFLEEGQKDKLRYNFDHLGVSPDNSKFVICHSPGILDIYSLKEGTIRHKSARKCTNLDSLFAFRGSYLEFNKWDIYSYADIFATNKRIYTAFDGRNSKFEIYKHKNGKFPMLYNNIAIYNWEGNALVRIKSDCEIELLCADEEHVMLYGVVKDGSGERFIGKLRMRKI